MSTRISVTGGAQEANASPPAVANDDDFTPVYGASRPSAEEAGAPYERAAKRIRRRVSKKHLIASTHALCRAYAARVTAAIERTDAARNLEDARRKLREAEARDAAAAAKLKEADDELANECSYPWGERDDTWVGGYAGLLRYKEENGHCKVPNRCPGFDDPDNKVHLGKWVSRQRFAYNKLRRGQDGSSDAKNPLYPWRQSLLEGVGFDWGTKLGKRVKMWDDHYADLLEHKRLHGHVDVSQTLENQERSSLARWVKSQRKNYKDSKAGKVGTGMSEERIRLLEEVGFSWRKKKYASRRGAGGDGCGEDANDDVEEEYEEEEDGSDDEVAEDEAGSMF